MLFQGPGTSLEISRAKSLARFPGRIGIARYFSATVRERRKSWTSIEEFRLLLLQPLRVKHPRFVNSFVGMRPKIISLRLKKISGQPFLAVAVKVCKGCTERRNGDSRLNRKGDSQAPTGLALLEN